MGVRADTRAWLHTIQLSVVSAGQVKACFETKPRDFGNAFPLSYIDDMPEVAEHGATGYGVFSRSIAPSIVVLDQQSENNAGAKRIDLAVDALVAAIVAAPHVGTGVDRGALSVEDIEVSDPAFLRTGARITLPSIDFSYLA